jgi:HAD superfamily hydrolase (TIGR01549 family)
MDFSGIHVLICPPDMKRVEVISFDAEGTVVTPDFSQAIWHEAIPGLYARKHGLGIAEAKEHVYEEYQRIGDQRLEWYDIDYWFNYLELGSSEPVIRSCLDRVAHYPEVTRVISSLGQRYKLIVSSGTPRQLLRFLLQDLESHFVRVFSSVSHFGQLKNPDFYLRICDEMDVDPGQIVHVGDNWQFDVVNPSRVGIRGVYLDRSGGNHGESISDLGQLEQLLQCSDR